jgi:putative membrane protein
MAKKIILFFILILATLLSCIGVRDFNDVLLNHVGTLVILSFLVWDISKNFLSVFSFICIAIFTLFHIVGARYLYSFVPYNDWSISIFGWDIQTYFSFSRNHYDRFVHFVFGILVFPALAELFTRKKKLSFKQAVWFSWLSLQSFSMIYELIEWLVALLLSTKSAENYNGQQGDVWDAHKDMALALLGSTIMLLYYLSRKEGGIPKINNSPNS